MRAKHVSTSRGTSMHQESGRFAYPPLLDQLDNRLCPSSQTRPRGPLRPVSQENCVHRLACTTTRKDSCGNLSPANRLVAVKMRVAESKQCPSKASSLELPYSLGAFQRSRQSWCCPIFCFHPSRASLCGSGLQRFPCVQQGKRRSDPFEPHEHHVDRTLTRRASCTVQPSGGSNAQAGKADAVHRRANNSDRENRGIARWMGRVRPCHLPC